MHYLQQISNDFNFGRNGKLFKRLKCLQNTIIFLSYPKTLNLLYGTNSLVGTLREIFMRSFLISVSVKPLGCSKAIYCIYSENFRQ